MDCSSISSGYSKSKISYFTPGKKKRGKANKGKQAKAIKRRRNKKR